MKKLIYSLLILVFLTGTTFAGVIILGSPAANSKWCINDPAHPVQIRWSETPKDNQFVKIRLFNPDLSVQILKIIESTDNDGEFDWTIPASIPPGQYRIRVKSVNNLAYGESAVFTIKVCGIIEPIQAGNLRGDHITALLPPDLKVSMIPMPAHPEIYQNSFVRFKVENVGGGQSKETKLRAFKSKHVPFALEEKCPNFKEEFVIDSWEVHPLNPGRSFSRDIKFNPRKAKPICWEAEVDPDNNIGDKNRANNRAKLKLKVNGPDLKIVRIYSPDYKKTIHQECKMEVTVENVGPVDAGRFEIDCDWHSCTGISLARQYKVCEQGLKSGESITFTFKHKYWCFGMKYPDLRVDKAKNVREQNERNNKCGFVFHLSGENTSGNTPRTHTQCD